jgi:hypothetical protein
MGMPKEEAGFYFGGQAYLSPVTRSQKLEVRSGSR